MCGIAGIVELGGASDEAVLARRVRSMMEALEHRGPDSAGLDCSPRAALGATRLAVRGGHDGRQPLVDAATGVVVVCNGEIDNHTELAAWLAARGRPTTPATDVAVLPGLYLELGEGLVDELAGVFALAIWDPRRDRLLLARDRAGERPLFYATVANGLVFASELSALARDPHVALDSDRAALAAYVRWGSFAAPRTPYRQARKLAPGEMLAFDRTGLATRRYWSWPMGRAPQTEPSTDAFDAVFRGAVQRQAQVDVPLGVFLSGGLDSSLVAAVARRVQPDVPLGAFCIRFGESSYDESDWAARVAEHLGLPLATVKIHAEDFPVEIARLIECVGEPLADPAWVPTALLARRAAQDVTVALVGEGGDELFGGYPTYLGLGLADAYTRLPRFVRGGLARVIEGWPPSDKKVTVSFLLKRFVEGLELEPLERHRLWTSTVRPAILARLGLAPDLAATAPPSVLPTAAPLDLVQRHDLETSLAEGLLTKADRAGMQSALELRAPFLDRDVLAFAATLPPHQRVSGFTTKRFLKRYAERYLPHAVVYRRKRGLSVPIGAWLRGPLHDWAKTRLGPELEEVGVSHRAARGLLAEHLRRAEDHGRAIWTLCVLGEWLRWAAARRDP
ncbi:MAG: asparagine synthase (glutamine-hydrolyzing) [bacterium]